MVETIQPEEQEEKHFYKYVKRTLGSSGKISVNMYVIRFLEEEQEKIQEIIEKKMMKISQI